VEAAWQTLTIPTTSIASCATLFARVDGPDSVFERVLQKYFGGERDARTIELLG
jgi:uncharacterized protein (DUF1810 family)